MNDWKQFERDLRAQAKHFAAKFRISEADAYHLITQGVDEEQIAHLARAARKSMFSAYDIHQVIQRMKPKTDYQDVFRRMQLVFSGKQVPCTDARADTAIDGSPVVKRPL